MNFSKEEKGKIDERELKHVLKEFKITKMNTNDQYESDDL